MIIRRLRSFASPALAALLVGTLAAACSGAPPPPAEAFVDATLGPGPMSNSAMCPIPTPATIVGLGTPTNPLTTPKDGSKEGGGSVTVHCTVSPGGDGFDINLLANKSGLNGGTMVISGHVTAGGGGDALSGSFTSTAWDFRASPTDGNPCKLDYTFYGNAVPDMPPVGPGHIWGHVVCPVATNAGQMRQCQGEANFKFDNCAGGS